MDALSLWWALTIAITASAQDYKDTYRVANYSIPRRKASTHSNGWCAYTFNTKEHANREDYSGCTCAMFSDKPLQTESSRQHHQLASLKLQLSMLEEPEPVVALGGGSNPWGRASALGILPHAWGAGGMVGRVKGKVYESTGRTSFLGAGGDWAPSRTTGSSSGGGVAKEVQRLRSVERELSRQLTALYAQLLHEMVKHSGDGGGFTSQDGTSWDVGQRLSEGLGEHDLELAGLTGLQRGLEQGHNDLLRVVVTHSVLLDRLKQQWQVSTEHAPPRQHRPQSPFRHTVSEPLPPIARYTRPRQRPQTGHTPAHHHTRQPAPWPANDFGMRSRPAQPPIAANSNKKKKANIIEKGPRRERPSVGHVRPAQRKPSEPKCKKQIPGPWRDCHQAWEAGIRTSGVTLLRPVSDKAPIRAWCDHDRDPGGWTVIQRREDGSINFDRPWKAYWRGFGSPRGENWLGLQAMHALTSKENQRLIILLEDWIGHHTVAEYGSFRVGSEVENGKLHLGHYRGTAGDALGVHDGRAFSARNRDNDAFAGNCATKQRGGWWYNACAQANLNGIWHQGGTYNGGEQLGIFWEPFHGTAYSLRRVVMMIRPNPNFYH